MRLPEPLRAPLRRLRSSLNRLAVETARRMRLGHYIVLEYPASHRRLPKTRPSGALHDVIRAHGDEYRSALGLILDYRDDLLRIPTLSQDERAPTWHNEFLPGLDGAAIYSFIRARRPHTYLEIGSGTSTRFARRAIDDGGLGTRIVSIDPAPRAEIDTLCDSVIRQPLECVEPSIFDQLKAGDVVFLDGSHRVFTGSDATVFILDHLPTLPSGVLVGVHDVYLPDDYPADIADRHYSEQYLLAALLLGSPAWLRVVLPAAFVTTVPQLHGMLSPIWSDPRMHGVTTHGVAFWIEIGAREAS